MSPLVHPDGSGRGHDRMPIVTEKIGGRFKGGSAFVDGWYDDGEPWCSYRRYCEGDVSQGNLDADNRYRRLSASP